MRVTDSFRVFKFGPMLIGYIMSRVAFANVCCRGEGGKMPSQIEQVTLERQRESCAPGTPGLLFHLMQSQYSYVTISKLELNTILYLLDWRLSILAVEPK